MVNARRGPGSVNARRLPRLWTIATSEHLHERDVVAVDDHLAVERAGRDFGLEHHDVFEDEPGAPRPPQDALHRQRRIVAEVANHGARQTRRADPPEPDHRSAVSGGWLHGWEFQLRNRRASAARRDVSKE